MEKVKHLIEDWNLNHTSDPAAIEKAAMEHAKRENDKFNSRCSMCGENKDPDEFLILDDKAAKTQFNPLLRYKKNSTIKVNACNKCNNKWFYHEFKPEHVRFKTAIDSPVDEISAFIERINLEVINSRANPYDLTDDLPHEAIPHIKADFIHLLEVPLEVMYYYAHLNHTKIRYAEEIFQDQYLSMPEGEYAGHFKKELEDTLVNTFGIKSGL